MQSRRQHKSDQIYHLLRRRIILLQMIPGSPVVEKELSAEYEVSRTPVREAIQKLSEEGLVTIYPHSGTIVSKISRKMAEEGFVIRQTLEAESARRAALRSHSALCAQLDGIVSQMRQIVDDGHLEAYIDVDDALHQAIAYASDISRMWRFVIMAKVDLDRMRQLSAPVPGHLARVTEEHTQIAEAIRRGKPDQAELAMRVHLESSFEVMLGLIDRGGDIFDDNEKIAS